MTKETETLDRLYLEWSQFTRAKTARELLLEAALQEIADLSSVSVRAPHIARRALEHKP